ncbi:IS4 family transposase [Desulfonatronum parangueonense]
MRELERAGHFVLPAGKKQPQIRTPRRLHAPLPEPLNVPCQAQDLKGLQLTLVRTDMQMRTWNEMMITYHPHGAGPLVGRQLRYLVKSDHGLLGGLGFAAAALHLADRDAWIGWSYEQRRAYLHYIIGLNRFLIRPGVHCRNLASKVLSMGLAAMAQDFKYAYNYNPLLVETFVESSTGTCFRAANWVHVGCTKGRGRQDNHRDPALNIKDIYVFALDQDFREHMGVAPKEVPGPLELTDGLDADQWAQNEFANAPIGDARLRKRLVRCAKEFSDKPGSSYSGVAKGDWAATKGYYRMIDQPDDSAMTMENILLPHRERTIRRMQAEQVVLCITDKSDLNYNNLSKCQGLGVIGCNQTGAQTRGLRMCSTYVVNTQGLPLGILKGSCKAPEPLSPEEKKRPSSTVPIEEKKTFDWIEHHRDLVEIKEQLPGTRLIHVCDREADFFELFDEQRANSSVDLLVRAKHDRNIGGEPGKLFATVAEQKALGRIEISVPRQSARPKKSKQKARAKRGERKAVLELRAMPVQIRPPGSNLEKLPVDIWVVHIREKHPPANDDRVEWFLLTTIAVASFDDAKICLNWYQLRWRIEDWHRVLKSGCRIEDLAHETAERLRRAIAIKMVIAWRIMLMTLLGRETPDLLADILFSSLELRVLEAFSKKTS